MLQDSRPTPPEPVFEFHSNFWVNLHHFLYQRARLREHENISRGETADSGDPPGAPNRAESSNTEPQAWIAALDYYAKNLAHRDLLFDEGMVLIENRLAELETCSDLSGKTSAACDSGLRPELVAVLDNAAPVYRARWWDEHDKRNREWISSVALMVEHMGGPLSQDLARIYQSQWPREPIQVDVVFYGGPFGAYTSLEPTHITVSSSDPRNQGMSAFEILFHESSHALSTSVQNGIIKACRARGIPTPRDLWHALLFYTTGELVRRAAVHTDLHQIAGTPASAGATYTPYAMRNGLYSRGWQDYQRVLEAYWQPYLDGKTDFDHAISSVVAGL